VSRNPLAHLSGRYEWPQSSLSVATDHSAVVVILEASDPARRRRWRDDKSSDFGLVAHGGEISSRSATTRSASVISPRPHCFANSLRHGFYRWTHALRRSHPAALAVRSEALRVRNSEALRKRLQINGPQRPRLVILFLKRNKPNASVNISVRSPVIQYSFHRSMHPQK
jgi:hypothetical protein